MVRAPAVRFAEEPDWVAETVAVYAAMVHERVHFAEAAYRDGEWYCMLDFDGKNINGERYDRTLGKMLRDTLLRPVGQWCVLWWPHPTKGMRAYQAARKWLAEHKPDVRWIPDRAVSRANELGKAAPFFAACRTRRVVLVGPAHLAALDLFPVAEHVRVPDAVAWQHTDRLCAEILTVVRPHDLVLICAGMAANLIVHRLWPELRGRATLLDMGATLDPYVGVFSRGVFREPGWRENVMPRNVP